MRIPLLTYVLLIAGFSQVAAAATARVAITHPTAPGKVVLRMSSGGGFVAPQTNLRALPSFTLYGDGTVIVPGAVPQIFPGPAIDPLVRSKLDERQVQALLKRARRSGLLARGAIDYGDMGSVGVSDAPTTTLVVNAGRRRVTRQAYALGIGVGSGRLTAKQVRARQALARFIAALPLKLSGASYTPHAIAVYVAQSAAPAPAGARRVVWPLRSDLATAGKPAANGLAYRCVTVGGTDVTTLLASLRTASAQSRWVVRGRANRTYQLVVRPLLPDEPGCPIATP
ncbi:MAG: hypothetical protein M3Q31_24640 [Actinomycetota bacterium]|nr:hypothetical protein [Actinomycetota bacterium]